MTNIPIREKPCKKAHNSKNIGCRMASPKKTHKVGGKKNYQPKVDPDTTVKKLLHLSYGERERRKKILSCCPILPSGSIKWNDSESQDP